MFPNTQQVYFPDIKDYCGESCSPGFTPYRISALFSDEASQSLDLFRSQMLSRFPFTIIPGRCLCVQPSEARVFLIPSGVTVNIADVKFVDRVGKSRRSSKDKSFSLAVYHDFHN